MKKISSQRLNLSKQNYNFDIDLEKAYMLFANYYYMNVRTRDNSAIAEFVMDKDTRTHINDAATWFTEKKRFGLILTGRCGTGKTTLAKSIMEGLSFYFKIDDYSLLSTNSRKIIEKATVDCRDIDKYRTCKILFIDDIGVEPSSVKIYGNEMSPVTDILYERYDRMKLTIATSNFSKKQLGEIYGARIADRFNEMFSEIGFNNPSYRK